MNIKQTNGEFIKRLLSLNSNFLIISAIAISSLALMGLSGCNFLDREGLAISTSRAGNSIRFRPATGLTTDLSFRTYISGPHGLKEYRRVNDEGEEVGRNLSIYWSNDGSLLYFVEGAGDYTAYAFDFKSRRTFVHPVAKKILFQRGGLGERIMDRSRLVVEERFASTEEVKSLDKAESFWQ